MAEALMRLARGARDAALGGMQAVGGFHAVAGSGWRQRRLLILCYHGVSLADEHEWDGRLFATPAFLRRRFEILRELRCNVLGLEEAARRVRDGTLPPRSVVLTFDDGFHDFLVAGVPLLEEFGYPATNYMSTYYSLHQDPIPNVALRYVLWKARGRTVAAGTFAMHPEAVDLADGDARTRLATRLLEDPRIAADGPRAQQEIVADAAAKVGVDWDAVYRAKLFHLLTAEEARETARRGFDLQLHTHRHRTPRDEALFRREIAENRRIIEGFTDRPAVHFCYPSGDVDAMFLPWLRAEGVTTATTTAVAGLAESHHEPLLLPRFVDTMAKSELAFASWVSGAGAIVARRGP